MYMCIYIYIYIHSSIIICICIYLSLSICISIDPDPHLLGRLPKPSREVSSFNRSKASIRSLSLGGSDA